MLGLQQFQPKLLKVKYTVSAKKKRIYELIFVLGCRECCVLRNNFEEKSLMFQCVCVIAHIFSSGLHRFNIFCLVSRVDVVCVRPFIL